MYRLSRFRLDVNQARGSPAMLVLTERDPIQTAFKLSNEFRQLSMIEIEFRKRLNITFFLFIYYMYIHFHDVNATLKLLIIFEPMVANVKTVSKKKHKNEPNIFSLLSGKSIWNWLKF